MSSKITSFPTSSAAEESAEKVLKRIKEAVHKSDHKYNYDATKTSTRNLREFRTFVPNREDAWRAHFDRKNETLTKGFFSDKYKPYKTIGKVYLSSEDILLENVTDKMKSLLSSQSSFPESCATTDVWEPPKISTASPPGGGVLRSRGKKRNYARNASGLQPIKDRLAELSEMKRHMKAHTNPRRLLRQQGKNIPSATEMITIDYLQTKDRQAESPRGMMKSPLKEHSMIELSPSPMLDSTTRKSSLKLLDKPKNNVISEPAKTDSKKKTESQIAYHSERLDAINQLFCAIFNMKMKRVKHSHLLSALQVFRLLHSPVVVDKDGRPAARKVLAPTLLGEDDSRVQSANTSQDRLASPVSASSSHRFHSERVKSPLPRENPLSTGPIISLKKQKLNQRIVRKLCDRRANSFSGVMTWDDLVGEKTLKKSHSQTMRKRDVVFQVAVDVSTPWLRLEQAEKVIRVKKAVNFLEDPPKKTAEICLQQIRDEYHLLQQRLEQDMYVECCNQKRHQARQMRLKLDAFTLQPFVETNLRRMRAAARLSSNRDAKMLKPLQWFLDLEMDINTELGGASNDKIMKLIDNVARFKYENIRTIPLAKEKLCLLVMSMPAHLLLPDSMTDSIVFFLEQVLECPAELLHCWLMKRKLDKISNIRKHSLYRR